MFFLVFFSLGMKRWLLSDLFCNCTPLIFAYVSLTVSGCKLSSVAAACLMTMSASDAFFDIAMTLQFFTISARWIDHKITQKKKTMLCCIIWCYILLCYIMLCYVVLWCYVILYGVMLCYVVVYDVMLYSMMLCYVILYCVILYFIILLFYILLYYIILFMAMFITFYWILFFDTV